MATIQECQHHFCTGCIKEWVEAQTELTGLLCPQIYCQGVFDPANGHLIEPPRLLRNMLSVLKFKCLNQGCDATVSYDEWHSHKGDCIHGTIICMFCDEEIVRKDLEKHKLGCISYVKHENSELEVKYDAVTIECNFLQQEKLFITKESISLKDENISLRWVNNSIKAENITLREENTKLKEESTALKDENSSIIISLGNSRNCIMQTKPTVINKPTPQKS